MKTANFDPRDLNLRDLRSVSVDAEIEWSAKAGLSEAQEGDDAEALLPPDLLAAYAHSHSAVKGFRSISVPEIIPPSPAE
jgi:hypothetical protein